MFTGYLQEGQLGVVFEDFGWYPLYLVSTQSSTTRFISDLKQFFNVFFAVCAIFFQVHYHFELILRWIYHVALEKIGTKLYISQLSGLQYEKSFSLTSSSHAGNLSYANKTNKLRKIEYVVVKAKTNSLDWWLCLKITVFCHLLNQKIICTIRIMMWVVTLVISYIRGRLDTYSHSSLINWENTLLVKFLILVPCNQL